jgi:ketosteroid isomerase-like protein
MCPDWTGEEAGGSQSDFADAVEAYRQALRSFGNGDPRSVTEFYSRSDDVTLANPLGPPRRGPEEVDKAIAEAATQVSDGSVPGFEEVSRYSTSDLGYVVRIERTQARLAGSADISPFSLRVTMIFRREGDAWRLVHRHADPIMTPRPASTMIEDGVEPSPAPA